MSSNGRDHGKARTQEIRLVDDQNTEGPETANGSCKDWVMRGRQHMGKAMNGKSSDDDMRCHRCNVS